jgi:glutathione S-transferase
MRCVFHSAVVLGLMIDRNTGTAVLITIPLSHYCEKVRWALDRVALHYREEPHAPLLHRLATNRNDGGTVPVLVHGNTRFLDSTDILVHADEVFGGNELYSLDAALRRDVAALEERFDTELGPHTRRWAYSQLLPHTRLLTSLWSRGVPRVEALLLRAIAPVVRRLVRAVYAAPVLLPGECRAVQPALDDLPPAMREEVLRLRNTVGGQFALRLFSQERDSLSARPDSRVP